MTVPSVRVSAPAHTRTPSDDSDAVAGRLLAALDRALPFVGPALAAVLGVVALGRRSLVVDEASLLAAARGSFSDVVEHAISNDPAKAGYLALLQPVAAAGDSEVWLRLPSVIAGVVAAVAAYRLGRRLAGRRAGAAASIVLATSVGVVSLTRTVGPLELGLAAMLVSSALFARAVERGNAFWWAVYALSAVLLPLTHPIAVSALAAQLGHGRRGERCCVRVLAIGACDPPSVERSDQRPQPQPARGLLGIRAQGNRAASAEGSADCPLGMDAAGRRRMVKRLEERDQVCSLCQAFDAQRALPRRRKAVVHLEARADARSESQADQASHREDDRVEPLSEAKK